MKSGFQFGLLICFSLLIGFGCSEQTEPITQTSSKPLTEEQSKLAWGYSRGTSSPQLELLLEYQAFEMGQADADPAHEELYHVIGGAVELQKESGVYRKTPEGISDTELRSLAQKLVRMADMPTDKDVDKWAETKKLPEIKESENTVHESLVKNLASKSFSDVASQATELKFLRAVKKALGGEEKRPTTSGMQ